MARETSNMALAFQNSTFRLALHAEVIEARSLRCKDLKNGCKPCEVFLQLVRLPHRHAPYHHHVFIARCNIMACSAD